MVELSAREIASATGAALVAGDASRVCRGVSIDSRTVSGDGIFVAFPGESVDGNGFAPAAVEAGAGCVVLTGDASPDLLALAGERGCAVLRAAGDDPTAFMLGLAGAWRTRHQDWTVVGVTGSVGKTTTKDMLARALATRYRVHATEGNYNNLIGVPLTLLSAPDDAEVLVVEMGMNHSGELGRLARVARPRVALVTNVGTSHIGLLGSRENIARAKAEVVEGMPPTSEGGPVRPCLFLPGEGDFTPLIADEYARPAGVEVVLVGPSPDDAVRAGDVTLDADGRPSFELSFDDGWTGDVTLSIPGRHAVADFLMAVAVADRLGCDRAAAAAAAAAMPPSHMRLEVVTEPGRPRVIDDSYNASPSSTAAALDVLCAMGCAGRRVAVLGEMGELGAQEYRLHGYVGSYAAAKPIDMLVAVGGELAGIMSEAAETMGMSEDRIERFATVDDALSALSPVLHEDDLVLVKASRAAGLDAFARGVLGR